MACRQYFTVEITNEQGGRISTVTRYAMNSGIRMSEQLVREHARGLGQVFQGDAPTREGDVYRRRWVGPDSVVFASVSRYL